MAQSHQEAIDAIGVLAAQQARVELAGDGTASQIGGLEPHPLLVRETDNLNRERQPLVLPIQSVHARDPRDYAQHPVIPVGQTAANLNFDGFLPTPVTESISLVGYERTTLKGLVESVANEFAYDLDPDPNPEQGYYYRSDHFSLAKVGVPAFSVGLGNRVIGKPEGWGAEQEAAYRDDRYHRQADNFDPAWDFSGLEKLALFGFELGRRVADSPDLPTWQPGDEFLPAREASWQD